MYALAILDRDARVLHLARDRFGEKPLFYAARDGFFAYGSDLGTLAALPWVGAEIDPLSLQRYLALHYVPGDATIYRHVRRVLPGERLEVAARRARLRSACATTCRRSAQRHRLTMTRSRRLSSTPLRRGSSPTFRSVCSFPAGSTARSSPAIAARHLPGVLTFSMGFASAEHDESEYARELATAIGSRHHHFRFDETSFATLLPAVVAAALDEPLGDQALLPVYWLAREARQHATVVLSGEGADEVFAGYGYYAPVRAEPRRARVSEACAGRGRSDEAAIPLIDNSPPVTPSGFPLLTDTAGRARLMPRRGSRHRRMGDGALRWLDGAHDPLQRATAADLATWLPDDLLVKYDRMAMAVSLEGPRAVSSAGARRRGARAAACGANERRTEQSRAAPRRAALAAGTDPRAAQARIRAADARMDRRMARFARRRPQRISARKRFPGSMSRSSWPSSTPTSRPGCSASGCCSR